MANTLASHISAHFIISGDPIYAYGKVASTYSVGQAVYESSAGTWTVMDADTAVTLDFNVGIVGYKERILSTGAKSSIDTAYATTDTGVPILIGKRAGELIFVAKIQDAIATHTKNKKFTLSETEGVIEHGTGTVAKLAAGDAQVPITNVGALVSGDIFMKARWL